MNRRTASADFRFRFCHLPSIRPASDPLVLREAPQHQRKCPGQEAGDGRDDQGPAGHVVVEQRMRALKKAGQRGDAGEQAEDAEGGEDEEGPGPVVGFHLFVIGAMG